MYIEFDGKIMSIEEAITKKI